MVEFVQDEHAVEIFQVVKHHNNLTLFITVRNIDQINPLGLWMPPPLRRVECNSCGLEWKPTHVRWDI